jgi:hypothetical protein
MHTDPIGRMSLVLVFWMVNTQRIGWPQVQAAFVFLAS